MSDLINSNSSKENEYDVIASFMRLSRAMRRQHPHPHFRNGAGPEGHGRHGGHKFGMEAEQTGRSPEPGGRRMMPPPPPPEGMMRLMKALSSNDGASSRELSELLDIRPSSLTELLTRAEKQGIITRMPDETDKRVVRVKLNDNGKKILETMEEHRRSHLEQITSCFTADETAQFCRLCDKLSDHIETIANESRSENESHRGPRSPFDNGFDDMMDKQGRRRCGHRGGHGHARMGHMPPPPPFSDFPDELDSEYGAPTEEE